MSELKNYQDKSVLEATRDRLEFAFDEFDAGMKSHSNRLVTLYDQEFDSLGARTISQYIFPDETARLKEIEQSE